MGFYPQGWPLGVTLAFLAAWTVGCFYVLNAIATQKFSMKTVFILMTATCVLALIVAKMVTD
jgi:hypothetical protein